MSLTLTPLESPLLVGWAWPAWSTWDMGLSP